jgi:hypothetical protein
MFSKLRTGRDHLRPMTEHKELFEAGLVRHHELLNQSENNCSETGHSRTHARQRIGLCLVLGETYGNDMRFFCVGLCESTVLERTRVTDELISDHFLARQIEVRLVKSGAYGQAPWCVTKGTNDIPQLLTLT